MNSSVPLLMLMLLLLIDPLLLLPLLLVFVAATDSELYDKSIDTTD